MIGIMPPAAQGKPGLQNLRRLSGGAAAEQAQEHTAGAQEGCRIGPDAEAAVGGGPAAAPLGLLL